MSIIHQNPNVVNSIRDLWIPMVNNLLEGGAHFYKTIVQGYIQRRKHSGANGIY
jgi:hypothetical protein